MRTGGGGGTPRWLGEAAALRGLVTGSRRDPTTGGSSFTMRGGVRSLSSVPTIAFLVFASTMLTLVVCVLYCALTPRREGIWEPEPVDDDDEPGEPVAPPAPRDDEDDGDDIDWGEFDRARAAYEPTPVLAPAPASAV